MKKKGSAPFAPAAVKTMARNKTLVGEKAIAGEKENRFFMRDVVG